MKSAQAYIRAQLTISLGERFSKVVRDAIFSDSTFTTELGLSSDSILSFGKSGVAVQRSTLLKGIRAGLAPRKSKKAVAVTDTEGETWTIELLRDGKYPKVALAQKKRRLIAYHFGLLSPTRKVRVGIFLDEAEAVHLPKDSVARWRTLLEKRPPNDDEIGDIQDDLNATPMAQINTIVENLSSGTVSLDVIIPRSEVYFERLVGQCPDGATLEDYVSGVAVPHMQALLGWRPADGLRLALLLVPQPRLSAALGELDVAEAAFIEIIELLTDAGDAMSRAAAIEMGLRRLPSERLILPLRKLIEALIADKPLSRVHQYDLLSALFLLVYGEMARRRLFMSKPPFWRRLAALAHASLIARCIFAVPADARKPMSWFGRARMQMFLLQCFADLRTDPRWMPELAMARPLRDEIGGRIWTTAVNHAELVKAAHLDDLLLDEAGGLRKHFDLAGGFLSGPLEGAVPAAIDLPADAAATINKDLTATRITLKSFAGLANAAMVFSFPTDLAELAANAIVRADYRLPCDDDDKLFVPYLLAIARVAAVARNMALADALFTLLRVYRRWHPTNLDVESAFRVAMVASASRSDLMEWCKCVGNCLDNLAFSPIEKQDAERLHSHMTQLCHIVPELWSTCGQAEAALCAVREQ